MEFNVFVLWFSWSFGKDRRARPTASYEFGAEI